jgi:hypothetical protein
VFVPQKNSILLSFEWRYGIEIDAVSLTGLDILGRAAGAVGGRPPRPTGNVNAISDADVLCSPLIVTPALSAESV